MLRFLNPDPGKAYISNNLWLPKSKIREFDIKSGLELITPGYDEEGSLVLWKETADHLIVPREYIDRRHYDKWPFPFIDLSPTNFPRVDFESSFVPRDEIQRDAHKKMLEAPCGLLNLSCGKGKTVIALGVLAELKTPTVIVVHTTTLVNQWLERIEEFLGVKEEDVGIVQGPRNEWGKPIVIAMIHSLALKANTIPSCVLRNYGLVIYDEVHHLSAPVFSRTAPLFLGRRYGLTATEERDDRTEAVYFYHIGKILYQNKGQALHPKIFFLPSGVRVKPKQHDSDKTLADNNFLDVSGEYNLMKIRSWIGMHERRNALIIQLIKDCLKSGRRILVIGHVLEQLHYLYDNIPESGLCVGEVDQSKRYEVLKSSQVVIATMQIAKEGLDQPLLDTLIVATPFSSKNSTEQAAGRILRESEGKKEPKVFVISDMEVIRIDSVLRKLRKGMRTLGFNYKNVRGYHSDLTK